jgi:outer membrane protein assembly factor BamB
MTKEIRLYANKTIIFATALTLIMALGAIAVPLISTVKAQAEATIPTQLFISISPNPVGVGQTVSVEAWLSVEPPQYIPGEYWGWNFTVNVIKPDGHNDTLGPFMSAPTGGYYTHYVPATAGNYTIQNIMPETKIEIPSTMYGLVTYPPGNYTFPAATSRAMTLTVQEDEVKPWPQTPLPTSYWTFPIWAENQDWYTIAGNWFKTGMGGVHYNPDTTGPSSPHILWTKPLTFGGISGGSSDQRGEWGINYYTGLLYENKFSPIIISGRLYHTYFPAGFGGGLLGVECLDLRTGEVLWSDPDMPTPTCGQVLTIQSGVEGGSSAFLWSGWSMYDAFTGRHFTTFENATGSLSPQYGPNGELLVYGYSSRGGYMYMWNSTLAVFGTATQFSAMMYSPEGRSVRDWNTGVQWNVTIPPTIGYPSSKMIDYEDGVLVAEGSLDWTSSNPTWNHYGYSLENGAQLWQQNRTDMYWGNGGYGTNPAVFGGLFGWSGAAGEGYYSVYVRETQRYHVYNIKTGLEAWVSEPINSLTGSDYSFYDWGQAIDSGMMRVAGYSGDIVAFNISTGQHLWTFTQPPTGATTPFATWPNFAGAGIATSDGKLYWGVAEHSPGTPLFRGFNLYCINLTTGEEIWHYPGFFNGESMAIAGGEVIGYAGYDNQIYAFGTGRSATTVSATPGLYNEMTIQGTVTDQSPGTTARGVPAAGTPAIDDAYMKQWMEYLYAQKPKPMNATGVPVTLTAVDPNGNTQDIGTVTSDIDGHYAVSFTPPVPGMYTITAAFAGSDSYYGSYGVTSISVGEAPAATPAPTPTPASVADMYFLPVSIGMIIAIVIVLALLVLLLLRKR